ncbi:nSTAND3 domain-containing NTPase [Virgisporangium aliadipatigenens]|nr:hypothetical protein [Virgisporangium aliadipatigenens]
MDAWHPHRIWISRIEDLERLLDGLADVPIDRLPSKNPALRSNWLNGTSLDRQSIKEDKFFVQGPEWSKPWGSAIDRLAKHGVLIVVAAPGVGASTFAKHLLAEAAPGDARLVQLDPGDWQEPIVSAIPVGAKQAAVIDLRDPQHDKPSSSFLAGLSGLSLQNLSMKSRLIITVREELWQRARSNEIRDVGIVYLSTPPDSESIVERYIESEAPSLLAAVQGEQVKPKITGRNAIQAMATVEKILQAYQLAKERLGETAQLSADDIKDVIDDHLGELDALFSEPGSSSQADHNGRGSQVQALSFDDRCLLITLASRGKATLSQLESDAESLKKVLRNDSGGQAARPIEPHTALSGAGLRGRLSRIQACTDFDESVRLQQPHLAEPVVQYVWDNYPAVRSSLVRWLVTIAKEGADQEAIAIKLISMVVRRRQDADFLRTDLARICTGSDQRRILTEVLIAALEDSHMQRRAERLLYDWAIRIDLQDVVVLSATRMLKTNRRDIAVRRLQRVADFDKTPPQVKQTIAAIFKDLATSTQVSNWFQTTSRTWFHNSPDSTASRLALAALLGTRIDGVPWLLTPEADESAVDSVLGELVSDIEVNEAIAALVRDSSSDDSTYWRVIDKLGTAAVRRGAIAPIINLADRLRDAGRAAGRDPVSDLSTRLKIRSIIPSDPHRTTVS